MALTDNEIRDQKIFFVDKPDANFNPKKNKAVVDNTIKKYELMRKRRFQEFNDELRERTDAVATYLKSLDNSTTGKPVDRYFGKRYLAHLRGQKIMEVIQNRVRALNSIDNMTIKS